MSSPLAPFTTSPNAVYPGADPGDPVFWRDGGFRFWLGQLGNLIELPSVFGDGYTANGTLGEVEHALANGTSGLTRFDSMTRRWSMQWPRLAGRDWQIVNGFYRRLFGSDPWAFLNPEDVNRLTLAQSMCGTLHGSLEGWGTTGGTAAYDPTVAAPMPPSGVIRWTGATTGNLLVAAPVVAGVVTPDPGVAVPYVAALPWTWSARLSVPTGTRSVILRLSGRNAAGAVVAEQSATVTVTTTPQVFTVTGQPTTLGASVFVVGELIANDTGSADILVATPQLTETNVTDWCAGSGVPRVALITGLGRAPDIHMSTAATLQLAETSTGIA